ncbi:maleylpyruvate isomerase family mycothiol-dependent enzyme [Streptomyces sp. SYP-A7185]|uniref:maleylpyruvate isomerase family mycothiol-dependent enzyme n=1 Tax=Streptomyces sp. SYP-A7185 TaxID=3040076 RepID=UPI0038F7D435
MSLRPTDVPDISWLGTPIDARPLFGPEQASLLGTLRALRRDDWSREAVPGWTVHDLAAHILGDHQGRLGRSAARHQTFRRAGETLEAFIHRGNQEWVDLHAEHSPADLIEALESAGAQVARRFEAMDLYAPGLAVSWAGADPAPAWLDIAREFTEYWTHRQHIRHATGLGTDRRPGALSMVLDTFLRALPHTLRHTPAPAGTQLRVLVDEPALAWTVTATTDRWSLAEASAGRPAVAVELDAETAWRLCTRGIDPDTALARARIRGERRFAEAVCQIVSIVH